MAAEQNEAVVRRMIVEIWNEHDLANFEDLVADDHLEHMAVPEHRRGIAGERYAMERAFSVFPDHPEPRPTLHVSVAGMAESGRTRPGRWRLGTPRRVGASAPCNLANLRRGPGC
ncbi:MAG TPA: ester cyclase [Rubrobacter sp.]